MAAIMDLNMEVQVARVKVRGLKRTKSDIIVEQVKDILSAKNAKEFFISLTEAGEKLESLKIFKSIAIKLDTVKGQSSKKVGVAKEVGGAAGEKIEVTFLVREEGWLRAQLGAVAGTQTGETSVSCALRNVFGRAEYLELGSTTSFPHWGNTLQLSLTKPYYKDLSKKLVLSVGGTDNKVPVCGYQESVTAGSAEVQFLSILGKHSLTLGCSSRQLYGFASGIPMVIREEAGYSTKSSIKHVLDLEDRDNPYFPKNGIHTKVTNELAGIAGGDVLHSKAEFMTEHMLELYRDWVLALNFWGGYLYSFTPSKINDRFLLGGPSTLRGFGLWGVGPREQGYSLGGEAYWASGLHLYGPLFSRNNILSGLRLHAFATAGNLISRASFSRAFLSSLVSGVRLSCGLGVHYRLGNLAQLELNYSIPIRAQPSDQVQPGIGFGIGLDML